LVGWLVGWVGEVGSEGFQNVMDFFCGLES
jgi:hypothetical protein